jgi:hypothetical protein
MCRNCHTATTIGCSLLSVPGNVVYSFQRGWGGHVALTSGAIGFDGPGAGVTLPVMLKAAPFWLPVRQGTIAAPRIQIKRLGQSIKEELGAEEEIVPCPGFAVRCLLT